MKPVETVFVILAYFKTFDLSIMNFSPSAVYFKGVCFINGNGTEILKVSRFLTPFLTLVLLLSLLTQAKKLVESLPQEIRANVSKEEAEKLKAALEAAGGTVVLE